MLGQSLGPWAARSLSLAAAGEVVEGGCAFGVEDCGDGAEGEFGNFDGDEGDSHFGADDIEGGGGVFEVVG